MATTIIQKTGTSGTAVMQKAYSGYTYVSQGTSAPGTTAISQKVIAGYTQVKGH